MLDEREYLLGIAGVTSGSAAVAELVVAEIYRRWYELDDHERAHVDAGHLDVNPHPPDGGAAAAHERTVARFVSACRANDRAALASLFADDVVAISDGGGQVRAAVEPIYGKGEVAPFLLDLLSGQAELQLTGESVNGRAGVVVRRRGRVVAVVTLAVVGASVATVWISLNPAKMRRWAIRLHSLPGAVEVLEPGE